MMYCAQLRQQPFYRLIDAHLSSMNYDANKLPLGNNITSDYTHLRLTLVCRKIGQVNYTCWLLGFEGLRLCVLNVEL